MIVDWLQTITVEEDIRIQHGIWAGPIRDPQGPEAAPDITARQTEVTIQGPTTGRHLDQAPTEA